MADLELSAGFNWGAARTGLEELRAFANNATRGIQSDIKGIFSGAGLAAGLSLAALEQGISRTVEYGDKIYELGKRFAVSTTAIQQFGNAAEKNGSSLESVAMGFNRLDIASSKALGGNNEIVKSFAKLGVTIDDLQSMTPEQIMLRIGSSSMNAADMVKILGKNGTELRETLKGLANGTEELSKAIDPEHIAALHRADDAWKTLMQNIKVISGNTLADVMNGWRFAWAWLGNLGSSQASGGSAGMKQMAKEQREAQLQTMMTPAGQAAMRGAKPEGASSGGAQDAQSLLASGAGAGAGGSGSSTADRIAKLQDEHAARQRTDAENLNVLIEKRIGLVMQEVAAGDDIEKKQQAILALEENQKDIDVLSAKLWKDQAETANKVLAERQKAGAQADQDLAKSKEANKELQLELQGRGDLAERAKIAFEYDEKIAKAQDDKAKAIKAGFTDVAATNQALIEQLGLEKANALAAHDKAVAEEKAAAAAKDAAAAASVAVDVGDAKRNLATIKERRAEQDLINRGLVQQADELRQNFDWDQKILEATNLANEAWAKMNEAYKQGSVLLGDQYAQLAKINEATERELTLQKQLTEEERNRATWQKGMQDFANNAGGGNVSGRAGFITGGRSEDALRGGATASQLAIAQAQDQVDALSGRQIGFQERAARDARDRAAAAADDRAAHARDLAAQQSVKDMWASILHSLQTGAATSIAQAQQIYFQQHPATQAATQLGPALQNQLAVMNAQLHALLEIARNTTLRRVG